MRRMILASTAVMLAVLASGIVASTSIGVSTASAAELASKTAFCGGNITIDKASANVDTNAGFSEGAGAPQVRPLDHGEEFALWHARHRGTGRDCRRTGGCCLWERE